MVPIKKAITYKLKFIDSFRLMPTSLSNLVDSLSETNKGECKACMEKLINQNVMLLNMKVVIYVSDVKNVIEYG